MVDKMHKNITLQPMALDTPDRKSGIDRRTLVVGSAAIASLGFTTWQSGLVNRLRRAVAPSPSEELLESILDTLPEEGEETEPLKRIDKALLRAENFCEFASGNLDQILREPSLEEARPIEILRNSSIHDLSLPEAQLLCHWLNASIHLAQARVAKTPQHTDQVLRYLHGHLNDSSPDMVEAHIMAFEGELSEFTSKDPRLHEILERRFKRGIRQIPNTNRDNDPIAHFTEGKQTPPLGELSWTMLVPSRLGFRFDETFLCLVDHNKQPIILSAMDLVPVAFDLCDLITNNLRNGHIPNLVEYGIHAIHGTLVLLGRYRITIQRLNPGLYTALCKKVLDALVLIFAKASKIETNPIIQCDQSGHALQALFDENAAGIFPGNSKQLLTAKEIMATQGETLLNGDSSELPTELLFLRRIIKFATADIKPLIESGYQSPISAVCSTSHLLAGLKKLKATLA